VPGQRARLEGELARVPWLVSWTLVRPALVEGAEVRRADLLMGDRREKGQDFCLRLDEADLPEGGGGVRAESALLLVHPDRSRYLPLFPMSQFRFQLQSQGVYLFQGCRWHERARPRRVQKAIFLAYDAGLKRHEEGAGEAAADQLARLVERLEKDLDGREAPRRGARRSGCPSPRLGWAGTRHGSRWGRRASCPACRCGWHRRSPVRAHGERSLLGRRRRRQR
jgi:hypothetical protein